MQFVDVCIWVVSVAKVQQSSDDEEEQIEAQSDGTWAPSKTNRSATLARLDKARNVRQPRSPMFISGSMFNEQKVESLSTQGLAPNHGVIPRHQLKRNR